MRVSSFFYFVYPFVYFPSNIHETPVTHRGANPFIQNVLDSLLGIIPHYSAHWGYVQSARTYRTEGVSPAHNRPHYFLWS